MAKQKKADDLYAVGYSDAEDSIHICIALRGLTDALIESHRFIKALVEESTVCPFTAGIIHAHKDFIVRHKRS